MISLVEAARILKQNYPLLIEADIRNLVTDGVIRHERRRVKRARQTADKRQRVLDFIVRWIAEHGYSPSMRDVCDGTGIKSTSDAARHLDALKEAGAITRTYGLSRSIVVLRSTVVLQPASKRKERKS